MQSSTRRSSAPTRRRPARRSSIKQSHGGAGAQARAVIDGLAGRRRDAGARLRHRRDRGQRPDRQELAGAAAGEFIALHLDDHFPGAQGQSESHQGLGRSGKARRRRHHAESENLRRRALELPRRLGSCLEEGPDARNRPRRSSPASTRTCRCSTPARVARPSPSSSAASATCCWPGRTKRFSRLREFGADKFEIVVPPLSDPGRTAGDHRRQGRRQERHARDRRRLSALLVHPGRPGDRGEELLPAARCRDRRRSTKTPSPR